MRIEKEIQTYYQGLKIVYNNMKQKYNKGSYYLSKKERQKNYMALIYQQGCIKSLEFVLGVDKEESNKQEKGENHENRE